MCVPHLPDAVANGGEQLVVVYQKGAPPVGGAQQVGELVVHSSFAGGCIGRLSSVHNNNMQVLPTTMKKWKLLAIADYRSQQRPAARGVQLQRGLSVPFTHSAAAWGGLWSHDLSCSLKTLAHSVCVA